MARPSVHLDPRAAELRLIIRADTPEGIFIEAARVVARECGAAVGEPGDWIAIQLEARDRPTLLVDWINELIGLSEVERRAFDDIRIQQLTETRLVAEVRGREVPAFGSRLKAATLHGLLLAPERGRWKAEVLLDV